MRIVIQDSPKFYHSGILDSFLTYPPLVEESFNKAQKLVESREYPRENLGTILKTYNQEIGNDALALQNIEKLKSGVACTVTGQQLGFMGGPVYTILKGISCLLLAKKTHTIPIFWLATEDHDIHEIDHTYLLDGLGNLQKYQIHLPKESLFVEDLELNEKGREVILRFFEAGGLKYIPKFFQNQKTYASFMAAFMARLFAGTGMVFLEPKLLRPLAKDFFRKEVEQADEIKNVIQHTTVRLVAAGGNAEIDLQRGTNLFVKRQGQRLKLFKEGTIFKVGKEEFSRDEMMGLIDQHPEIFSTNVAARPVLQSLILPTVAYVAGLSELKYHGQLRDYFHFHGIEMPWIVPRLSATFVTPFADKILSKCSLKPWDNIPVHWFQVIPNIETSLEPMVKEWNQIAQKYLKDDLSEASISRYAQQGARSLKKRVVKMRLRREGIPYYGLHYLRNLIHPHNKPQERILNWWGFQAQTEENLIHKVLEEIDWPVNSLVYIYL